MLNVRAIFAGVLIAGLGGLAWIGYRAMQGVQPADRSTAAGPSATGAGASDRTITELRDQLQATRKKLELAQAALLKLRARAAEPPSEAERLPGLTPANTAGSTSAGAKLASTAPRLDVIRALLMAQDNERWKALKGLGIEITSDDFRALLAGVDIKDWKTVNQLNRILPQWVECDPQATAAWLTSLASGTDDERLDFAYSQVASAWISKDATACRQWIDSLPRGRRRDNCIQRTIWQISSTDPSKAAELSASIADDNIRASTFPMIAASWANKDAAGAAKWVAALPAGQGRDNAVQHLAPALARTDATAAMEWAAAVADENSRQQAVASVVGQWARQNSSAAADWVNRLPAGRQRDLAVQQFAMATASADPPAAVQWAESIEDSSIHDASLQSIAWQWLSRDRAAATNWIASSSLAPSIKSSLLSHAERMRTRNTVTSVGGTAGGQGVTVVGGTPGGVNIVLTTP